MKVSKPRGSFSCSQMQDDDFVEEIKRKDGPRCCMYVSDCFFSSFFPYLKTLDDSYGKVPNGVRIEKCSGSPG